jgi:hypothetical protein
MMHNTFANIPPPYIVVTVCIAVVGVVAVVVVSLIRSKRSRKI